MAMLCVTGVWFSRTRKTIGDGRLNKVKKKKVDQKIIKGMEEGEAKNNNLRTQYK